MKIKQREGFSVIELLVAMVILGIIAGIAIPGFARWLPRKRLKSAALDLYSNMQWAKMGAVRDRGEWAMVFNTGAGTYQIVSGGADGDFSTAGDNRVEKTVTLANYQSAVGYGSGSAGAPFDAGRGFDNNITFDDTDGGADGDDTVIFNSRGMINPQINTDGEVYLTNANGTSYVVCARASGVVVLRKWTGAAWQ